ncbi:hypothetical protein E5676_scaffold228G00330 [Cucumis melo var. makuwa]|uniref:Ubiquitin-like protease family profile domain-containing protein n=1 Tax=Cucumis melo var. makuwa TaxID=1194695 RepID=A0A5D3D9U4_CUCMM|nr:hypothetical protein E6C27_scaffold125G002040 [Cucumis melo var. makuwa]TYK20342.1 hypothetical protein E5676_scaffold228G00330 [Cucumis melo var. makuwa]
MYEENDIGNIKEMVEIAHEQYAKDPSGFEKFLNNVEKPLYEGCKKSTKLSTLMKLYNLKVRHRWSNISFSELLKALKDILPSPNDLSTSMYEAKKILGALGMEYEKIHTCPNDYGLYRKKYVNAIVCPECGTLLDIPGKAKDGLNARRDLADLKIRPELTPINGDKKIFIPLACYALTKKEKRFLLKTLSKMKVPRGYSSNVRNLVSIEDSKLDGLKSHDCHVLLQQLLLVAIRSVLSKHNKILDKSPNDESPNNALSQALGTPEYGGRVQKIPTSEHGSCSKSKVQEKEKVLENVVKEKKKIATSVPPISLTSKKKVVEEEEVIVTRPSISKNEVKASRPMTKEVEVTSEPSNLPIQLKYILRYAERVTVDGSSFSFQLPLELFGIPRKSYVLREDVIDFCNMQKVKTLSMVAYIVYLYSLIIDLKKVSKYIFVDPSLISASHSTREIRARNLCSRLMTSKQDQLVVAPYNPRDHWSLVVINPYDDVVYHLDSLRTSSRDDIKYITNMALTIFQSQKNLKKTRKTTFWKACPLQVGTVECGYYA